MCIVFHIGFWTHFLQIRRVCHHFYFKPYRLHHISSPSPFFHFHTFHQPHRFDMFSFIVKFIGVVTFFHFMSFYFSFYAICINVLIFGFFLTLSFSSPLWSFMYLVFVDQIFQFHRFVTFIIFMFYHPHVHVSTSFWSAYISKFFQSYDLLATHLHHHARIHLNQGKTRVWNAAGAEPPNTASLGPDVWVGSPSLPATHQGLTVLGAPVGSPMFVQHQL